MTVDKILERLKDFCRANNLPVTENAFTGTIDDPVPDLPYVVYTLPHDTGRGADTINNLKIRELNIELYTQEDDQDRKDLANGIETEVLMDVDYEEFLAPIESEECYQTAFEMANLITKMKGV